MNAALAELADRIGEGRVIVLAGAGISMAATGGGHVEGEVVALWTGLLRHGVKWCRGRVPECDASWERCVLDDIARGDADALTRAASELKRALTSQGTGGLYGKWLEASVGSLEVVDPSLPRALVALGCPLLTTNIDEVLTNATGCGYVTWEKPAKIQAIMQGSDSAIGHLHGHWRDEDSVVLDGSSYASLLKASSAQAMQQGAATMTSLALFGCGATLEDPNFLHLRSWMRAALKETGLWHYWIVPDVEEEHARRLVEGDDIHVISHGGCGDLLRFVQGLLVASRRPSFFEPEVEFRVPPAVPNQQARRALLEKIDEALSVDGRTARASLTGLGGVGKSALAAEYARTRRDRYSLIAWIRAEQAASDLAELADAMNLPTQGLSRAAQAAQVVSALERRREPWLLVFDNVNDSSELDGMCPDEGHIVFTSKRIDLNLPGARVPVEVFGPETAVAFLQERSGQPDPVGARAVAEELGFLPLALAYAGAYCLGGIPFSEYLRLVRELPIDDAFQDADDREIAIRRTWTPSIEMAEAATPGSRRLLAELSFLDPDRIPVSLLEMAPQGSAPTRWEVNRCLRSLLDYSLVHRHDSTLSIHRLLQRVVRDDCRAQGSSTETARLMVQRLASRAPSDPTALAEWSTARDLVPHIAALANHAPDDAASDELDDLLDVASNYLFSAGLIREKLALDEVATSRVDRIFGTTSDRAMRSHYNRAMGLHEDGQTKAAIRTMRRVLQQRKRALGEDHVDTLRARHELARYLFHVGKRRDALQRSGKLLEDKRRLLGPDNQSTLFTEHEHAVHLSGCGHHAQALEVGRSVMKRRRRILGKENLYTLKSEQQVAVYLRCSDDRGGALRHARRVLRAKVEQLGERHPSTLYAMHELGECLIALGRTDEAREELAKTLAAREEILGRRHFDTAATKSLLESIG